MAQDTGCAGWPYRVGSTRTMKLPNVIARWFRKRPSAAERRLLQRCAGDQAQVERLIAHELQRRPGLSRAEASESATDRWNRDR